MATTRLFSDIDFSFIPHPSTGDITLKTNEFAIKNAIKNLIMTNHFERQFHSEIGSPVNKLLFELPSYATVVLLQEEINNTILNFEPRADVIDIQVGFSPDNNLVGINIIFKIRNTNIQQNLQFSVKRTR